MSRREFIALLAGAAAWPLAARAQETEKIRQVAMLLPYSDDAEAQRYVAAFEDGLKELRWIPGRNIHIEYRFGAGDVSRMQRLATELAAFNPDVIFAANTPSLVALKRLTNKTPILFANIADPVGSGLVESLAHPGGKLTGFTNFEPSMAAKWLEMLTELLPHFAKATVIYNPSAAPYAPTYLDPIESAAATIGITVDPQGVDDIGAVDKTLSSLGGDKSAGLIVLPDAFTSSNHAAIVGLAERYRVPAIYAYSVFVKAGGLMSYGPDPADQYRQVASYVDRILRGSNPADLPVQTPTKFYLVINLKTAKALGLAVPLTLQATADDVIE